ncbi:MAG: hypothetical protein FWD75_07265 [Propionibacteriaceae bacterium]|nr:hypothetical protein [Propionibacteriaceae bacterium]
MPEQLIIGFNPMSAANKVAYYGNQIRSRVLWLVVAMIVCVWIWLWQRQSMSGSDTGLLFGAGLLYSLIWLGVAIVNWSRAKSALSAISPGVAAAVDRQGMWLAGVGMAWPEIAQVAIAPGRFGGSPNLSVKRVDGHVSKISVADLDVAPGTIDAAVRSYSNGTQSIDTSRLGN